MSQFSIPLPSLNPAIAIAGDGRSAPDRSAPGQLETLAHEFESMMLYQLLRQMRQSMTFEDAATRGFGADTLGQTIDLEFARQLSLQGGIGVADLIIRQMSAATSATATPQGAAQLLLQQAPSLGVLPSAPAPAPGAADAPAGAPVHPADDPSEHLTELPLGGQLTSRFGWRPDPIDGRGRFHRGVDIRAAYGVDVPAPLPGRVTAAGAHGGYGLTVVVEHANGTSTRYAHLSEVLVQPGDQVQEGALLGRVGNTGRSTAPHLHFEVLIDGQAVDPEGALAAAQGFATGADYLRRPPVDKGVTRSGHED